MVYCQIRNGIHYVWKTVTSNFFVLKSLPLERRLYCCNKVMYQTVTASLFNWLAIHSRLAVPSIHVLCEACFVASLKMPWFCGQISV